MLMGLVTKNGILPIDFGVGPHARFLDFVEERRIMAKAETKVWTFDELHSLPDDGNKYELLHGELFVTPAPTFGHETIIARLNAVLVPFVMAHRLGYVYIGNSGVPEYWIVDGTRPLDIRLVDACGPESRA